MAGTKEGGKAAALTNKSKYGHNYYAKIGSMGGKKSRGGGFAANRELARIAGAKGGRKSRRGKSPRHDTYIETGSKEVVTITPPKKDFSFKRWLLKRGF